MQAALNRRIGAAGRAAAAALCLAALAAAGVAAAQEPGPGSLRGAAP